ncbi:MAG: S9 family peptidase [Bdellovibrionia bacterium]
MKCQTSFWGILALLMMFPTDTLALAGTTPPMVERKPESFEMHGDVRIDPYHWLKERDNPKVLEYLRAENEYLEEIMAPTQSLQEKIIQEIASRTAENESTLPDRLGEYLYYSRFESGKEYPIYCRKKANLDTSKVSSIKRVEPSVLEETVVDINELAHGHSFIDWTAPKPSLDQSRVAFAVDTGGRRFYSIHFKDLRTGQKLPDVIENVTGDLVWANDNRTVFYVKQNPVTLRAERVLRHVLGEHSDKEVYFEKDETFALTLFKTLTHQFLVIDSMSTTTTESRILKADYPDSEFQVFLPRQRGHEYILADGNDGFYIRTNYQAQNYRLMKAPYDSKQLSEWSEVLPYRDETLLKEFQVFQSHLVLDEQVDGRSRLRVIDRSTEKSEIIEFPDSTFALSIGANVDYAPVTFRYTYSSLVQPHSDYEYDFKNHTSILKHQRPVPNLDLTQYVTKRIFATARDGTLIPISIAYKKGLKLNSKAPLLQYAYGAYGYSQEPHFDVDLMSLLDRGFVYALAHVRGGSEQGRQWYEDGKLLHKKNTFTDFIDCTEALIGQGYVDPKRIFARGRSAGGLLMGAVMNMRSDLYHGIIAEVPFVDVLNSTSDRTIPLATTELDEWGNPEDETYYRYLKGYSPYDNIQKKAYPHLLITTGYQDSQVQYWEPAKWAAKLRSLKTDQNVLLFKTQMESGHAGSSGRFERIRETAFEYAFILMTAK